jgi:hypothetical protein
MTNLENQAPLGGGQLPPPPDGRTWDSPSIAEHGGWPMLNNDSYGDCTVAGADHMMMCWAANALEEFWTFNNTLALADFNHLRTGDNDAQAFHILAGWELFGLHRNVGGAASPVRIDDFCPLKKSDPQALRLQIKQSIALLGGCYLTFALPVFSTGPNANGQVGGFWTEDWTKSDAYLTAKGAQAAKSVLNHCVNAIGYDGDMLSIVTWGALQTMSLDFYVKYHLETYAVLCRAAWLRPDRTTPSGLSDAQLQRVFNALKAAGDDGG